MGCTHYPLIINEIREVLGNVTFYDGSNGVARRLLNIIKENKFIGLGNDVFFFDSSNSIIKKERFYSILEGDYE